MDLMDATACSENTCLKRMRGYWVHSWADDREEMSKETDSIFSISKAENNDLDKRGKEEGDKNVSMNALEEEKQER